MSLLNYKSIVWEAYGKGAFIHGDCSVSWNDRLGVFQFKQGDNLILARELRSDCLKDATDCILDTYAKQFVPIWEQDHGTAQEAQG